MRQMADCSRPSTHMKPSQQFVFFRTTGNISLITTECLTTCSQVCWDHLQANDCDQLVDTDHHLPEHRTLESVNEPVGCAVLNWPLTCASGDLQFTDTAGTLERTGRLSSLDKMLSNKSPSSPTTTSPTTPCLTSSPRSTASVLIEVLSKKDICEPSQLGFLRSSPVTKVCGGCAGLWGPGQFSLRQFGQWESACGLCTTPLCVSTVFFVFKNTLTSTIHSLLILTSSDVANSK